MPWDQVHGGLITSMASDHAAHSLPFLERGHSHLRHQAARRLLPRRAQDRGDGAAERNGNDLRFGAPLHPGLPRHRRPPEAGRPGRPGKSSIVTSRTASGRAPGRIRSPPAAASSSISASTASNRSATLLGSDVATVSCVGGKFFHTTAESEATCVITVQFKNDAIAIAEVLAAQNPITATVPSLRVTGTKGTVEAFLDESPARRYRGAPLHDPASYEYLSGNRGHRHRHRQDDEDQAAAHATTTISWPFPASWPWPGFPTSRRRRSTLRSFPPREPRR